MYMYMCYLGDHLTLYSLDFTLCNARQFYASKGEPLGLKAVVSKQAGDHRSSAGYLIV